MKVEYQRDFDGFDTRSLRFLIEPSEISRLSELDQRRLEALLTRGQFEDVIEALTIVHDGGNQSWWSGFGPGISEEDIRRAAGDWWDKAHAQYGDFNPFGEDPPFGTLPGWWTILGVNHDANKSEIKKAYRDLAKQHHPDAGGDPIKFYEIKEAYDKAMAGR